MSVSNEASECEAAQPRASSPDSRHVAISMLLDLLTLMQHVVWTQPRAADFFCSLVQVESVVFDAAFMGDICIRNYFWGICVNRTCILHLINLSYTILLIVNYVLECCADVLGCAR